MIACLLPSRQADPALVDSIVEASKKQGQFGLIIDDDKDRSPAGELAALHGLWPALRPGGVYVVRVAVCPARSAARSRWVVMLLHRASSGKPASPQNVHSGAAPCRTLWRASARACFIKLRAACRPRCVLHGAPGACCRLTWRACCALVPVQVESLPTSHQPGMSSSSGASGGIAPFIRQAIDDLECSSDTALVDPAWQAYCGRPEYVQGITRSFAAVECCTDACAIVKRRAPR